MNLKPDHYVASPGMDVKGMTLNRLTEEHPVGYVSIGDEPYAHHPVCTACQVSWPCDTAKALSITEGVHAEVTRLLNPVLKRLRRDFGEVSGGVDPLLVPHDEEWADLTGLPETVEVDTRALVEWAIATRDALGATYTAMGLEDD